MLRFVDRVAVDDDGEGPAVVCVHGLGGSGNTFEPLLGALARRRVVRIDLPGSARSQGAEGEVSLPRFVQTVKDVCARLEIERAVFVGHSMGTIVCQHVAVAEPALVQALALYGPLVAPTDAARAGLRGRAAKLRADGAAGLHEVALSLLQAALSGHTRQHAPLAVAFVRESLMRQDPEGYARSCEALADAQGAAVEGIEVPTLLVTGDEDAVAPPQSVQALAARLTRARHRKTVVLPRCGHWTPLERPDECTRELAELLALAERR